MIGREFRITGKVQGVYFRASTQQQAQRLGIHGWAINLPDGSVEVFAYGEERSVEQLRRWLLQGPPFAQVDSIRSVESEQADPGKFSIR